MAFEKKVRQAASITGRATARFWTPFPRPAVAGDTLRLAEETGQPSDFRGFRDISSMAFLPKTPLFASFGKTGIQFSFRHLEGLETALRLLFFCFPLFLLFLLSTFLAPSHSETLDSR